MSTRLSNGLICLIILLLVLMRPGIAQIVGPSSMDKSVVYFLRGSYHKKFDPAENLQTPSIYLADIAIPLGAFNLDSDLGRLYIYDSNIVIAELFICEYIRYECKSGYHLFWAEGKRNGYLEAELQGGKVYFVDVTPIYGGKRANFRPIQPDNTFWIDGIRSFISSQESKSYSEKSLLKAQKRKRRDIIKGLSRIDEEIAKGMIIGKLYKNMYYRQPKTFDLGPD